MPRKRYIPVKENRLFTHDTTYDCINWNDFDTVVDAFDARINEWYLRPIETLLKASVHFGFPVVGLTCLLVDTLSQYFYGKLESSATTFKDFVRANLPSFATPLPQAISVPQILGVDKTIVDFAEALYYGFRCGILHEANVTQYGMIVGQDTAIKSVPSGYTKYVDTRDCPSIILDPRCFVTEVDFFYMDYITNLKDSSAQFDTLRSNFREKFAWNFGIDIGNE